eukprot:350468-Chlamydomonas_euryale.AAC.9
MRGVGRGLMAACARHARGLLISEAIRGADHCNSWARSMTGATSRNVIQRRDVAPTPGRIGDGWN